MQDEVVGVDGLLRSKRLIYYIVQVDGYHIPKGSTIVVNICTYLMLPFADMCYLRIRGYQTEYSAIQLHLMNQTDSTPTVS